ncbi:hypothetical protein SLS62_005099 [Diatrype stigma]|uniref:Uncharacterized protein n=1 Tax=Diatrype stigma TaxID=117547 RepID=A0AAN9UQ75_9PEZI
MFRAGRGNKRRYDDHGRDTRPARVAWEEDFDYEVRQLKRNAIENYGSEKGIPVLSFKFIGEGRIREAHRALLGGGDLRDRVAPRNPGSSAAATAEVSAKRQKKGAAADNTKGVKKDGNAKAVEAKPPKEDKATTLKRFDDELDSYFSKGEQAKEAKKEDKPVAVEKSQEKETTQ